MKMPPLDQEKAAAAMKRGLEELQFWADNRACLVEQYPEEWVAVMDGKVVAHSREMTQLFTELESRGLLGIVWVKLLTREPLRLLL